jgi:hypothetical protein
MRTGVPTPTPSVSLAEQYSSFAAYALSTEATPRPASTSLDVARFHAYTGEISFSTDPQVRLYLDGGTVYHAERDGDPPISQVLRDLGVVQADQLERGMVRVGDVEHLGRLFEREPSIDRDAVMVVMETRSEAIVRELANRATASVTISAYRHHPSGIHRWFVAAQDATGSHRPVSAVAQVDRSVVDELPALQASPPPLEIEWAEPDPSGPLPAPLPTPNAADLATPVVPASADPADLSARGIESAPTADEVGAISPLGEFQIVWPDGTAEDAIVHDDPSETPNPTPAVITPPAATPTPAVTTPSAATVPFPAPTPSALPAPAAPATDADTVPDEAPVAAEPDAVGGPPPAEPQPAFSIAPLQVDSLPEPDAAVPHDVAAAVKRALEAIENASTGRVSVPELAVTPITLPELHLPTTPDPVPRAEVADPTAPTPAAPPGPAGQPAGVLAPPPVDPAPAPLGFAPPTPDMRAEVVYERAITAARTTPAATTDVADDPTTDATDDETLPGPGRASVVFVDEEPEPAAERRGALRRLISSLRHKDD